MAKNPFLKNARKLDDIDFWLRETMKEKAEAGKPVRAVYVMVFSESDGDIKGSLQKTACRVFENQDRLLNDMELIYALSRDIHIRHDCRVNAAKKIIKNKK